MNCCRIVGRPQPRLPETVGPRQDGITARLQNAADIAMVIDVMDLIASGLYHGFCLVTSDSDFTPLAMRIRRAGLKVYGFGAQQTPEVFVQACSRFVYVEGLVRE